MQPAGATIKALSESAVRQYQMGDFAGAEHLATEIVAHEPGNFIGCYILGLVRHRRGQNLEALAALNAALKTNPHAAEACIMQGLVLQRLGRFEEALASFDRALAIKPNLVEAHNNRGNALCDLKRYADALASYDKALKLQPLFAPTFYNRGVALQALKRLKEALRCYDRALELNANYPDALSNRGSVLRELKRFDEALQSFDRALTFNKRDPAAWFNRGTVLRDMKRYDEAQKSFDAALAIKPDFAEAFNNRGIVLQQQKKFQEALTDFSRAMDIAPDYIDAWINYGNILREMRYFGDALAVFERVVALKPDHAVGWNNLGAVLQALKRYDEALEAFDKASALEPDYTEALCNRGTALQGLNRHEEALAVFDRVLDGQPDYPEALHWRGNTLWVLSGSKAALEDYDKALQAKPDYPEALNSRGFALASLKRSEEALASYSGALALKPDFAEALYNRGNLRWTHERDYRGAVADLERAIAIDPAHEYARGDLLHLHMHACDWNGFEGEVRLVDEGVRSGQRVMRPFGYQAVSQSPADLQKCSRIYANHLFPPAVQSGPKAFPQGKKIRVGYMSGEFREQATASLTAGLYELHDRDAFEIVAIDTGTTDGSPMRRRLENAFSRFIRVFDDSDRVAAEKIRAEEIDILVNLNGYFGDLRMGICAHRPAPIQVNYLGFPATLGADFIDYIVADRTVIPEDEQAYYDETVVYLPHSYQVNDDKRIHPDIRPARAEHRLPDGAFVFCSFNQSYKLTPAMFSTWIRLLKQVEGSVLWLLENNPWQAENLRQEAVRQGLAPDRLIFAPPAEPDKHLARLPLADLFLDSLPYNAHTTASDALWMGLPVVTCMGSTFPGRVAASVLKAARVSELITDNMDNYEALALRLARDADLLTSLRQKLQEDRATKPLFDTDAFRRHLETAYRTMWNMHRRGERPRSFCVEA